MSRIFEGVSTYLKSTFDADDWETDDDGDQTVAFRLEDPEGNEWDGAVLIDEDAERVVFYSTLLDKVAGKRRPEMMELLTRANYALPIGNFELDLDDGEVCFKTYLELEDVELTDAMCAHLITSNLSMMSTYFGALIKVATGVATAKAAVSEVEEAFSQDDEDDEDDE